MVKPTPTLGIDPKGVEHDGEDVRTTGLKDSICRDSDGVSGTTF